MMRRCLLTSTTAWMCTVSLVHAATTLDFDDLEGSLQLSGTPPASTVLTDEFVGDGILFGRAGLSAGVAVFAIDLGSVPNSIIGLEADGTIKPDATSDIFFSFVQPGNANVAGTTDSVSFLLGDAGGDVDMFDISVFDLDGNLLELRSVASEAFALRSFDLPGMHRFQIDFDDSATGGYLLDDLTFGPVSFPTAVVPLPAPLSLLVGGIGVLGLVTRRRRG